jgi:Cu/Ag efflux protein CusF
MTRRSLVLGWTALGVASRMALAGPAPRIVHTLHGTVRAVDPASRSLTVHARRMEEWMETIEASYSVDNMKLLREVKAGDQIMGQIFEGEMALHHVEIVAVAAPHDPARG